MAPESSWELRQTVVPGAAPSFREPIAKRPYPQTLISGPSLLPLPTPPLPPASLTDPGMFHGVVPTSSGGVPVPSSQPADWAQLQLQMQVLSQSNPAFYTQMQQFFWSQQNMLQMQQHQMHAAAVAVAAQGYHIQPQPAAGGGGGGGVSATPGFAGTEGDYNVANAGGAGGQYVQMAPPGGLFIPPMTHIPSPHDHHLAEETDTSQTPRRSLAIPIVPPKVYT